MVNITWISFSNYKSFDKFYISLNNFNILVGPNNAWKSTVIWAIKILAEWIRMAKSKRATILNGPKWVDVLWYQIDLQQVPIATENVFHNYDDTKPAIVRFKLSNNDYLQIYFLKKGICYMNHESEKIVIRLPKEFKEHLNIEIWYVPILWPVEHNEQLYQKEVMRLKK